MKALFSGACAVLALLGTPRVGLGELQLPEASPAAQVAQTVGLTKITVAYSSPATRGREVWGQLVPYDTHWRTGANTNTLITFSRNVEIGGVEVPEGTYSLHTIPGKKEWLFVLNQKVDGGGSASYDASQDVVRTKVPVQEAPPRERMTFLFSDTDESSTQLDLEWAGVRVRLPIQVSTQPQVDLAIQRAMDGLWREPARAAAYLVDQGRDLDRALELIDRSIGLRVTWYNHWIKARIRAAQGHNPEAIQLTQKALDMGDDSGAFAFYSKEMKAALKTWGES